MPEYDFGVFVSLASEALVGMTRGLEDSSNDMRRVVVPTFASAYWRWTSGNLERMLQLNIRDLTGRVVPTNAITEGDFVNFLGIAHTTKDGGKVWQVSYNSDPIQIPIVPEVIVASTEEIYRITQKFTHTDLIETDFYRSVA